MDGKAQSEAREPWRGRRRFEVSGCCCSWPQSCRLPSWCRRWRWRSRPWCWCWCWCRCWCLHCCSDWSLSSSSSSGQDKPWRGNVESIHISALASPLVLSVRNGFFVRRRCAAICLIRVPIGPRCCRESCFFSLFLLFWDEEQQVLIDACVLLFFPAEIAESGPTWMDCSCPPTVRA